MIRLIAILVLCGLLAPITPCVAAGTPAQFEFAGLPYDKAKIFYSELRSAVARGDKKTVSSLIIYPFAASINGKGVELKNEAEFIKNYESIFTPKILDSLKQTDFDGLILQPVGAMTPGGLVWIGGTTTTNNSRGQHVIRVIAINN